MDKTKGDSDQGWEVGMASMGKWRQLYLNNNKKNKIKKKSSVENFPLSVYCNSFFVSLLLTVFLKVAATVTFCETKVAEQHFSFILQHFSKNRVN